MRKTSGKRFPTSTYSIQENTQEIQQYAFLKTSKFIAIPHSIKQERRNLMINYLLLIVFVTTSLVACNTMNKKPINPKIESKDENVPQLTSPKVRRVWVAPRIEGDKYFDGHYMYVIEKNTSWSK